MALATQKHLGQHWLHDPLVIDRIAQACLRDADLTQAVIEIGPGEGALTQALLQQGAKVIALELDPRCIEVLQAKPEAKTGQLKIIHADALKTDWPHLLASTGARRVVGNLPYNVGTELVARLLLVPQPLEALVFLLQKEVVLRLAAQPNTPDWGRLGVLSSLLADSRRLFDVGPGAFTPPPKVMSSVIELRPLPRRRYEADLAKLDIVLRAGFGQRRKMLRSALKGILTEAQIASAQVLPTARMEVLDVPALCRLARLLG
jgi:16S rRNA (adenine1518-N6/adenine1519-N6)-dimethyltransferase